MVISGVRFLSHVVLKQIDKWSDKSDIIIDVSYSLDHAFVNILSI